MFEKGTLDASRFDWSSESTYLNSPNDVLIACISYLVAIWVSRAILRSPVSLPRVVSATHNAILCLGSLVMFMGAGWEVYQESRRLGSIQWLLCLPPGTPMKGALYFWSYTYYLSKYYELLDTVLLVLKKKPLSFLHVFHHATVIPMAYFWLADAQSLQQIALLTNTFIHVLMYFYYFLCSLGRGPNWKRLITNAQIVQFVFSFTVSVPFWWQLAQGKNCSGLKAMIFNAGFNFILLALFINFHRKTYAARSGHKKRG